MNSSVTALDFSAVGTLFGYSDTPDDDLVTVNTATGAASNVGPSRISTRDAGIAFDGSGTLWGVFEDGKVVTFNTTTGAATVQHTGLGQLSTLAIPKANSAGVPEPGGIAAWSLLFGSIAGCRRRRKA